jgi:hypothetical protein
LARSLILLKNFAKSLECSAKSFVGNLSFVNSVRSFAETLILAGFAKSYSKILAKIPGYFAKIPAKSLDPVAPAKSPGYFAKILAKSFVGLVIYSSPVIPAKKIVERSVNLVRGFAEILVLAGLAKSFAEKYSKILAKSLEYFV